MTGLTSTIVWMNMLYVILEACQTETFLKSKHVGITKIVTSLATQSNLFLCKFYAQVLETAWQNKTRKLFYKIVKKDLQ